MLSQYHQGKSQNGRLFLHNYNIVEVQDEQTQKRDKPCSSSLGINPSAGETERQEKGPREGVRTPVGQMKINTINNIAQVEGDCKDGKSI